MKDPLMGRGQNPIRDLEAKFPKLGITIESKTEKKLSETTQVINAHEF